MRPSPDAQEDKPDWLARVAWLLALWIGGVAALAGAAWLIKLVMRAAGFA